MNTPAQLITKFFNSLGSVPDPIIFYFFIDFEIKIGTEL